MLNLIDLKLKSFYSTNPPRCSQILGIIRSFNSSSVYYLSIFSSHLFFLQYQIEIRRWKHEKRSC